ncbi:MAG TPA: signal peptidase II [bacterium]|nr:signal peptidase II [bacterium]HPT29552.1 signal peptidase II [bacterium]
MFKLKIKSIAYIFAAMLFVLDRFLKLALENGLLSGPHNIIGRVLRFNLANNPYIAFSLPVNQILIIILDSAIVLILIFYITRLILAKKWNSPELLPLTFLTLGATSNVLDRWRFGYVVDYLDLSYFTVFNLADVMIVLSIIYLIFTLNKKSYVQSGANK